MVCRNKSEDLYLEFWRLLKPILKPRFFRRITLQSSIEQKALDTFQKKYMDYEPTGSTPSRCEMIPTKGTIESLRAMPTDNLTEEFRENHSFESFDVKESKVSLIPPAPLAQIN